MTLAIYLAFLIAEGRSWADLGNVQRDYAEIERLLAFAGLDKATPGHVLSAASLAFIGEGKKISAIKQVRAEHEKATGAWMGLKEAKDVVDAYILANPHAYNVPF